MNDGIGYLALLLAGSLAFAQCLLPVLAGRNPRIQKLVIACAQGQFFLLLLSVGALGYGFYSHDYSLRYVAEHSNNDLPWYYRLSALWGGHEGSLLLWIFILSLWTAAFAWKSKDLPGLFRSRVLAVLGYISLGFIAFIVWTSNPFARQWLPIPFDGRDLNPLLQDPGLVFHPPLLYTGYVGFAVAFAFVIAGLWQGRLDALWLKRARPWTLAAWVALTLGITLGSYWAYYELGWGGWWFWDPVENASLMPWLIGGALVHSLAVSERRGGFMIWTALLAIFAFALSLVGTFLVRSGVLTSVHAFASDPSRGLFILLLLVLIVGPALLLLVLRADTISRKMSYALLSRETGLLANNWLFTGACLVVLLGTLYPLVADVLGLGKISVGAPYFNRFIVPIALVALALMGFAPLLRYRKDQWLRSFLYLLASLCGGGILTAGVVVLLHDGLQTETLIALFVAGMALSGVLLDFLRVLRKKTLPTMTHAGMLLAHTGFIVLALAISAVGLYSIERDVSIRQGQTLSIAGYRVTLLGMSDEKGPNYEAMRGVFEITRPDAPNFLALLEPAKRHYFSSPMPMTESARLIRPTHDLYVAIGEKIGDHSWAIRLQYKPLVLWLWLGGLIMAVGGVLAARGQSKKRSAL